MEKTRRGFLAGLVGTAAVGVTGRAFAKAPVTQLVTSGQNAGQFQSHQQVTGAGRAPVSQTMRLGDQTYTGIADLKQKVVGGGKVGQTTLLGDSDGQVQSKQIAIRPTGPVSQGFGIGTLETDSVTIVNQTVKGAQKLAY